MVSNILKGKSCLFCPLEGPGSLRGGNTRRIGNVHNITNPPPLRPGKLGKNCREFAVSHFRDCFSSILWAIRRQYSTFSGIGPWEGDFVIFPHVSRISTPQGFRIFSGSKQLASLARKIYRLYPTPKNLSRHR